MYLQCVTDYYLLRTLTLCCKPGKSSKFRPILHTQVASTDFHEDEAKFKNG